MAAWSEAELERITNAEELEITSRRANGSFRGWLPIWVVTVGDQVFVRTWHRRTTGWFGNAVDSHRACVRVPGLEADVIVEDIGEGPSDLRAGIDEAYRAKYARHGRESVERMVADAAAAATLRLVRT